MLYCLQLAILERMLMQMDMLNIVKQWVPDFACQAEDMEQAA